jgi:uncharacterized membrane protein
MVFDLFFALALISALGCGLMAGLFFAFSSFIMKALSRLPAPQGIAAMQSINVAVINPVFLSVFFGTAAGCFLLTMLSLFGWHEPGSEYLLAGSLLYLLGTFLVTVIFNVSLNRALAAVEPASAEGARLWSVYLRSWTRWNHVRALAALVATASLMLALRFMC